MRRRDVLNAFALAAISGLIPRVGFAADEDPYDIGRFGNARGLHFTDCHAQLLPVYFREPSVNIGVADAAGRPPHLVGEAFLKQYAIAPGTPQAYAFTYLDFDRAARTYGRLGGFAHLSTLVKKLRAQ